jgi:hypothetical protein
MAEAPGDLITDLVNAETGDTTQFTSIVENGGNTFGVTSSNPLHGTKSYKLLYGGSSGATYAVKDFVTDQNSSQWIRFYIYIPSSTKFNLSWDVIRLCNFYTAADDLVACFGISFTSNVASRWMGGFRYSYSYIDTNFSLDTLHYVELNYVRNAGIGGIDIYVDGILIYSDMLNDSSGYYAAKVRLGDLSGNSSPDSGGYIIFDDLKGATTQIGAYQDSSQSISVSIEESTSMADGDTIITSHSLVLNESMTGADSDSKLSGRSINIAETINLTDLIIVLSAHSLTISSVLTLIDNANYGNSISVIITELLNNTDNASIKSGRSISCVESVQIVDANTTVINIITSCNDLINFIEVINFLKVGTVGIFETVNLRDIVILPSKNVGEVTISFASKQGEIIFNIKQGKIIFN